MDKLLKGAVDTLPATKELIEVQEALPLPEPESGGVSVGTGNEGPAACGAVGARSLVPKGSDPPPTPPSPPIDPITASIA